MGAVELLLLPCLHKSADESSWGVKRERNVPVVESWEQSRATESQSQAAETITGECCLECAAVKDPFLSHSLDIVLKFWKTGNFVFL